MTAMSIVPRLPHNSTAFVKVSSGIDFLVVEYLAAETDDGGVFFIQTGERAVVSNDIDQLGVDSSPEANDLMRVPLKVVVGFADPDQVFLCLRLLTRERNSRSQH